MPNLLEGFGELGGRWGRGGWFSPLLHRFCSWWRCPSEEKLRVPELPASSSSLHGLWRGSVELQHLVSSQNQQRGIYSGKVTKLQGLGASASLLESLTRAIHWNTFKAVGMSKALTPNLMGEKKNVFGPKFACYVN